MNAVADKKSVTNTASGPILATLDQSIANACKRIAPTWPLDQFIAVNPYWGFYNQPIKRAAAQLANLSGTSLTMPHSYYRECWQAGQLQRSDLQAAIDSSGTLCNIDALINELDAPGIKAEADISRVALMTELIDAHRDLQHKMAWGDFVTHQISQYCAAHFDQHQASWAPDRSASLYADWRAQAVNDFSPMLLMGLPLSGAKVSHLPSTPRELIVAATLALGIPESGCEDYYTALLLSINGWASWCAYERWQAGLDGKANSTNDSIVHLLAIRLAWEWLLHDSDHPERGAMQAKWLAAWRNHASLLAQAESAQNHDWLLQQALEIAYQKPLCQALLQAPPTPTAAALTVESTAEPAAVQALFCIDVRSEVFRRALEAASTQIQTVGFAGFFGLPIAYSPIGTAMTRPQLPGLLSPASTITDEAIDEHNAPSLGDVIARRRQQNLQWRQQWQNFRTAANSGFTFVESLGLLYAGKLLKSNLASQDTTPAVEQKGLSRADLDTLRPRFAATSNATEIAQRGEMAAGILGAMGLTKNFARLVLLAGHGSQSANNPHAAGLDCGACGGQTGEVNARALAALLNDEAVRQSLQASGINVPDSTRFISGLHNTTTDEMHLYDLDLLPPSHAKDLAQLRQWLITAGQRARRERAAALGLHAISHDATAVEYAVKTRANDWAQVRPEWALANNAAFIVAPRARSKHINLAGRSFLHDYDWQQDANLSVLELIMTAPMIVTNWINLQYYASTVDNRRYGSGNKVLHNVVGGRLGVFEGNGGDLRIGLPWQSLHDGEVLRHTPLRLSVFIEAPEAGINSIIAKHEMVKQLLDHEWLYLFRIDADSNSISRYCDGLWKPVA